MSEGGKPSNQPSDHDVIVEEISEELKRWEALNLAPATSPPFDIFILEVNVHTILKFIEMTLTDEQKAEFEMLQKRTMLANLKEYRAMAEPLIAQAKLEAIRNGHRLPGSG